MFRDKNAEMQKKIDQKYLRVNQQKIEAIKHT